MSTGMAQYDNQHLNNLLVHNTIRVKSEGVSNTSSVNLFPDHFGLDVMSARLKQQEGIAPTVNEIDFDDCKFECTYSL
ncbi:hypothetical protein V6N13_091396 [Hibiscus sabdariffa]